MSQSQFHQSWTASVSAPICYHLRRSNKCESCSACRSSDPWLKNCGHNIFARYCLWELNAPWLTSGLNIPGAALMFSRSVHRYLITWSNSSWCPTSKRPQHQLLRLTISFLRTTYELHRKYYLSGIFLTPHLWGPVQHRSSLSPLVRCALSTRSGNYHSSRSNTKRATVVWLSIGSLNRPWIHRVTNQISVLEARKILLTGDVIHWSFGSARYLYIRASTHDCVSSISIWLLWRVIAHTIIFSMPPKKLLVFCDGTGQDGLIVPSK